MKMTFDLRQICTIYVLFIFLINSSKAQQEIPLFGFVRIVNTVSPGDGNTNFSVDQEDIYPTGYQLGQDSGGISMKEGTHAITVNKNGVRKGTTKIDVVTGETTTVIAFAELVPSLKKDDPPVWIIKLLRLKQNNIDQGYGLTMVSVADTPETAVILTIGGKGTRENYTLSRLKYTYVSLGGNRGEVFIKKGNKNLTTVSPDTPGNYVVVFYEDEKGETAAIYFFDPKFTVAG